MKRRFIINFLKFVIVLLGICLVLGIVLPSRPYYGNLMLEEKMSQVNTKDIELYFFGSSRAATGIIPHVFDSTLDVYQMSSNSYNMASYGTWLMENMSIIEGFTNEKDINNATYLIEFQNVMSLNWDKIDSDRNLYYQNVHTLEFALQYMYDQRQSIRGLLKGGHLVLTYSLSNFLNAFNLGKSDVFIRGTKSRYNFDSYGFLGLDTHDNVSKKVIEEGYQKESAKLFHKKDNNFSQSYLSMLNSLIDKMNERNNKVIFILVPKNYTPEMAAVYRALPEENKVDASTYFNQSFFDEQYFADNTHFNVSGAKAFTEYLAQAYFVLSEN